MKVSDVEIHHDRHVVFSKQIRHGAVLVEFPEFLSESAAGGQSESLSHIGTSRRAPSARLRGGSQRRSDRTLPENQTKPSSLYFSTKSTVPSYFVPRILTRQSRQPPMSRPQMHGPHPEAAQNARFCNLVRQIRIFLASALRIVSFPSS